VADIPKPQSPLEERISLGSQPGLSVQELPGITQIQLLASKPAPGKKLSALEGVEGDGLYICATASGEYWVFSENHDARGVETLLGKKFGESASLFDQSHGRMLLRLEGPRTIEILAKGSPLDFDTLPTRGAAHTVIEHIPVLISRREAAGPYDISVPRSYAASFIAWLEEAI
jgi:sarcosine oxidase subunit gamma